MSASINHSTPRFNKTWSTFIQKFTSTNAWRQFHRTLQHFYLIFFTHSCIILFCAVVVINIIIWVSPLKCPHTCTNTYKYRVHIHSHTCTHVQHIYKIPPLVRLPPCHACLSVYLTVYMPICLSICPSVCPSDLFTHLFVCWSVCSSVRPHNNHPPDLFTIRDQC